MTLAVRGDAGDAERVVAAESAYDQVGGRVRAARHCEWKGDQLVAGHGAQLMDASLPSLAGGRPFS